MPGRIKIVWAVVEVVESAATASFMVLYEPETGLALLSTTSAPAAGEVRIHPVAAAACVDAVEVLTLELEIVVLTLDVVLGTAAVVWTVIAVAG